MWENWFNDTHDSVISHGPIHCVLPEQVTGKLCNISALTLLTSSLRTSVCHVSGRFSLLTNVAACFFVTRHESPFSYLALLAGVIVHDKEPLPVPFWSRSCKGNIEMCPSKLREKLSVHFFIHFLQNHTFPISDCY